MRTTASYDLFPDAPSERAVARARWLAREGRFADAETAYRGVLAEHPDLKIGWAEYFDLVRRQRRPADALHVAELAETQFGASAFVLALRGAALTELDRFRDALTALERAAEQDPDLAIVWHELGYAAYRLGDRTRALLALDRAFALEPHTGTLKLRGRILRDAGRYQAAEVAFEGAAQAAEHAEQRDEAEREIVATRRYAFYAPRRPADLSPAERWFAETGAVVLAPDPGPTAPSDAVLVRAFAELAHDRGWEFGQVIALGPDTPAFAELARALAAPLVGGHAYDEERIPLIAAPRVLTGDGLWTACIQTIRRRGAGLVFVLEHPADAASTADADVIGVLTDGQRRRPRMPSAAHALAEAQHPGARCANRRLGRT